MMKRGRPYNNRIYAAYQGDRYLMDGTLDEIAKALGRKRKNLQWFLTPACYRKQHAPTKIGKPHKDQFTLTLIDEDENNG